MLALRLSQMSSPTPSNVQIPVLPALGKLHKEVSLHRKPVILDLPIALQSHLLWSPKSANGPIHADPMQLRPEKHKGKTNLVSGEKRRNDFEYLQVGDILADTRPMTRSKLFPLTSA